MRTSTSKGARVAAGIVCAVYVAFVLIHLLWAVGITWGLEEMFGEWTEGSVALTFASLLGAAAGAAVIYVTISRVGWHKTRLPDRLLHLGNWVAFSWPAIGTLNPSTTWGNAGCDGAAGDRDVRRRTVAPAAAGRRSATAAGHACAGRTLSRSCERQSVRVVLPAGSRSSMSSRRCEGGRSIGHDVHRDFCAVAIRDGRGRARSVGRVQATPEQLELFAQSLGPNDRVALEATSNALAIARILEPHVAEVVFAQPEKRASPQGAQAGLAPWPGRHRLDDAVADRGGAGEALRRAGDAGRLYRRRR